MLNDGSLIKHDKSRKSCYFSQKVGRFYNSLDVAINNLILDIQIQTSISKKSNDLGVGEAALLQQ